MTTLKTLALSSLSLCSLQAFAQVNSEIFQADTVYRIDQHIDTTTMNPLLLPAGKPLPTTRIVKVRARTFEYMAETKGTIRAHRFEPLEKGDKGSRIPEPRQSNIALHQAGRYKFHRIHQSSGYSTCVYLEPSENNQPRRYILLETHYLAKLSGPDDLDRQFPMGNSERTNLQAMRTAVRSFQPSPTRRATPIRSIGNDDPVAVPDNTPTPDKPVVKHIEEMPEFPGGSDSLNRFIAAHLKYPAEAIKNNISGRVTVRFVVRDDGSTSDFTVMRRLGYGCDEEALRVLKSMPRWKPSKKDGQPVSVTYMLPVQFYLR